MELKLRSGAHLSLLSGHADRLLHVLDDVAMERASQEDSCRNGRFTATCAHPNMSDVERYVLLSREFHEVGRAVHLQVDLRPELLAEQTSAKLRKELVQVAAVAVAWVEAIDKLERDENE